MDTAAILDYNHWKEILLAQHKRDGHREIGLFWKFIFAGEGRRAFALCEWVYLTVRRAIIGPLYPRFCNNDDGDTSFALPPDVVDDIICHVSTLVATPVAQTDQF